MVGRTMKSLIVRKELEKSEFEEIPIPEPGDNEVLIKVACTASNPKDWKMVQFTDKEYNTGDDIAGIVEKVGKNVHEFVPGQRVAAFHVMTTPNGSYAEYAIAPDHTTFHIPASTTFEEASTIPLAAMTAALGLRKLGLPDVFTPARSDDPRPTGPLLIYGGATAVGAFAIKIAKNAGIKPIIAVAGDSQDFVKSLGADVVVDYRSGDVVQKIRDSLNGAKLLHAYDCASIPASFEPTAKALDKGAKLTHILPPPEGFAPEGVQLIGTNVGAAHDFDYGTISDIPNGTIADWDFAAAMFRWFGKAMKEGRFSGHPQQVVGGLEKVAPMLKAMQEGKNRGVKYVYRVSDEQ